MTAHEWTDVTMRIDGKDLPMASVEIRDVGEPIVPGSASTGWWPQTIEGFTMVPIDLSMFLAAPRYQRIRWSRLCHGMSEMNWTRAYGGSAHVNRFWCEADNLAPWRAEVMWGACGAITRFARRCDAKRWCAATLAQWDARGRVDGVPAP